MIENANYEEDNYRELLAIDDNTFTIEKIDDYFKEIIKENEYNIENYNLLVEKNYQLEEKIRILENDNKLKDDKLKKSQIELQKYRPDKIKTASNFTICKYGYYLYAFECEKMRYKCSISIQKDFEHMTNNLKQLDPKGSMKYYTKVSYPFSEKIMLFILKQSLTLLGNNTFEGSYEDIKKILDITTKLESMLINNCKDLDKLSDIIDGKYNNYENINTNIDAETPQIKKAKRSIDQINPNTGEIIKTYESIEAAGRGLGLTTGTAVGIALREKRVCQGFLWRYTGISKEDQYSDQPVIKVCCSTGEKTHFNTIADAARDKDANISAPALRQRILTKVHLNDFHWIFDKSSSHYT